MASYNLMVEHDRDRLRHDRQAELAAVKAGLWPRDTDDLMRWSGGVGTAERCLKAELGYLDGVDTRLAAGDPDLEGWEGWNQDGRVG